MKYLNLSKITISKEGRSYRTSTAWYIYKFLKSYVGYWIFSIYKQHSQLSGFTLYLVNMEGQK